MKQLSTFAAASIISFSALFADEEPIHIAKFFAKTNQQAISSSSPYQAKDFSYLLGMPGFTNDALNLHFKLYQGYVNNTNLFLSLLQQYAQEGKEKSVQYTEIKRRLGWEFDGMRLHELYFYNLGGQDTQLDTNSQLYKQIVKDFGSYDAWKKDFIATGAMRGIGWVALYFDPIEGRLLNIWVGEHDAGNLVGGTPILIMDVWEHAYMLDYGLDRMDYFKAFFNNVNWPLVQKRFASNG
ncbi:MAG: superoxide dismutase [Chlamydiales bacterium]